MHMHILLRSILAAATLSVGASAQFFLPPTTFAVGSTSLAATIDLDNDGDDDGVGTTNGPFLGTLINQFPVSFFPGPLIPVAQSAADVASGDMDGDGDDDLVAVGTSMVSVVFIHGNSITRTDLPYTNFGARAVRLLDLDGDGDRDIIVGGDFYWLLSWINNGPLGFAGPSAIVVAPTGDPTPFSCIGDLDGDGDADLVSATSVSNPGFFTYATTVEILLQTSPGVFETTQILPPSASFFNEPAERFAIADVTGDGNQDIVIAGIYDGIDMLVLRGLGSGQFAVQQVIALAGGGVLGGAYSLSQFRIADLDNDGADDVVLTFGSGTSAIDYIRTGSPNGLISLLGFLGGWGGRKFLDVDGAGGLDAISIVPTSTGNDVNVQISGIAQSTPPTYLATVVSGSAQSAMIGQPYAAPLRVRIRDAAGNPVAGEPVSFLPLSGAVAPTTATTDANGYAQTNVVAGTAGGAVTVYAGSVNSNVTTTTLYETGLFVTSTPQSGTLSSVAATFFYPRAGVPFSLAVDFPQPFPGFTSTIFGEVWTSILSPSSTVFLYDGLGLAGPAATQYRTALPSFSIASTVDIATFAGSSFVFQVYAYDPSLPFPARVVVSNPVIMTF